MKSKLGIVTLYVVLAYSIGCNQAGTETTTDSTTSITNTDDGKTEVSIKPSANTSFDESGAYVSLQSNKPIKLRRDTTSGYLIDYETSQPITFIINPATSDTFDRHGNVVNNYLIKGTDGSYTLDEERWKTKTDEDGDTKAKDGEDTKMKTDGNEPESKLKADGSKEKVDENSYKSKTADGKVKSKDDKTKVKQKNQ